eukprot:jgi/Tetstr1/454011/TSEL_040930.t1
MDAVALLDASSSMRRHRTAITATMQRVAARMPPGARLAVVCYPDPDASDEQPVRLMQDFTSDPCAVAAAVRAVRYRDDGDAPGAQRLAIAKLLSPCFLAWRPPAEARGVVLHFTDAMPRAEGDPLSDQRLAAHERNAVRLGAGFTADWIALGRALSRGDVAVHTVLFPGEHFARAAPWHAVMAALTGAAGVYAARRDSHGMAKRLSSIVDGRAPADGAQVRLSAEAMDRLWETPDERNASNLLTDGAGLRVDGSDMDARVALAPAFLGLVRSDASNRRCPYRPDYLEHALRAGHAALLAGLSRALADNQDGGDEEPCDVVTSMTFRELCVEFCRRARAGTARPLADLLMDVATVVVGPAICAPFTSAASGGRYNYQSSFSLRVRAVRQGYRMSYASFLAYCGSKRDGRWQADRVEDLRRGVDDLVLRADGDITGILPVVPGPSRLARRAFALLAATPWLDAIAWHSACRHVFPPPHACAGLVAAALWCGAGDPRVTDDTMHAMVDTARRVAPVPQPAPDGEVGKHVAAAAQAEAGAPWDWAGLAAAGTRQKCARLPRSARGRAGYLSGLHAGRYHAPASHAAVVSEVDAAVRRVAAAAGLPPPASAGVRALAARELLRALFGVDTHEALCGEHARPRGALAAEAAAFTPPAGSLPRRTLPTMGTPRFNRRLAELARAFRRARGMPDTGEPGERMRVAAADVPPDDPSPGAAVLRGSGSAEFVYADGGWTPVRLGGCVRAVCTRGGREVRAWAPA